MKNVIYITAILVILTAGITEWMVYREQRAPVVVPSAALVFSPEAMKESEIAAAMAQREPKKSSLPPLSFAPARKAEVVAPFTPPASTEAKTPEVHVKTIPLSFPISATNPSPTPIPVTNSNHRNA